MVQVRQGPFSVPVLGSGRARASRAGARQAPPAPGCYLFRDAGDAVIYVGKSVSLRARLASYFSGRRERKVLAMVRRARTIEWHVAGSEIEALILESQLIKHYQPPYNVLGRDYPHYTFLRLADGGGYPYLEVSASLDADGHSYFGPFWGRRSAEQTLDFVNRLFALRHCTGDLPPPETGQACFYAQIRRCSAPCLGRVTAEGYAAAVRSAAELLKGDIGRLITRLERERDAAAEGLRFEKAAELHQIILTLRSLQSKQRHLRSASSITNFLVVVHRPDEQQAQVLAFSAARLRGRLTIPQAMGGEDLRALERFILEHYPARRQLAIDLDELDQMHVVAEWLSRQGRRAAYVPLPDGPLTAADARRAAQAIAGALSERPPA
jgi:excinuclease UvrABC nuclease subunit